MRSDCGNWRSIQSQRCNILGGGEPASLVRQYVRQPVSIDGDAERTPAVFQSSFRQRGRETRKQFLAPVEACLPRKGSQCVGRRVIEISPRRRWICLSVAPQEAAHIPAIFAEQGPLLVFRMTLQ